MNKIVDTKDTDAATPEQALVDQAKQRFAAGYSADQENRIEAAEDLRMEAGKDHWPEDIKKLRKGRPCLTINKLPTYVDQVTNDARLNKIAIKIKPAGGKATKDIANTLNGIIRNIEAQSKASAAYTHALECAAKCGFGYFRITTEYVDDSTFDLDIRVKRIKNPFTVVLDPDRMEADGRDKKWAFVSKKVKRSEFKKQHPNAQDPEPFSAGQAGEVDALWYDEDTVRVAEYWVMEPKVKELVLLDTGETYEAAEFDMIQDELAKMAQDAEIEPPKELKRRTVDSHEVWQYLIDGNQIISKTLWPGRYIPIIEVMGKETVLDTGEVVRRGVIRHAKDPQRLYNYARSSSAETTAMVPKAPYLLSKEQIKGHENLWQDSTKKNLPYLLYNETKSGQTPKRQVITQTAIGEITESQLANDEMKATTATYDASLGAQGNETSGRAILARQREGDVSNFTYHDNLQRAVELGGEIMIDIIPNVYDTERQLIILNDDGTDEPVVVNKVIIDEQTGKEVILNDLSMGKYKVVSTTGPSFTTRRVEAAQGMMDFIRVAPESASAIMDLIAEAQDWPMSARIANRIRKGLGIDENGDPLQPQNPGPTPEDIERALKAEGTSLSNQVKAMQLKKLSEEEQMRLTTVAQYAAQGAVDHIIKLLQSSEGGTNDQTGTTNAGG